MKIKSAKSFRHWYKTKIKEIDADDLIHNENFVGTYYKKNGKKTIKGFFEMYHGDKPDIASYLPSILKIAEEPTASSVGFGPYFGLILVFLRSKPISDVPLGKITPPFTLLNL